METRNNPRNNLSELQANSSSPVAKIFSQNVDDHPGFRFPEGRSGYVNAFPEDKFSSRFPLIQEFYTSKIQTGFNMFVLQEVGDDAAESLKNFFEQDKFNFSCIINKYNLDKGCVNYITAYKKDVFQVQSQQQVYFTESGNSLTDEQRKAMPREEKFKHNYAVEFEKSAQITTFAFSAIRGSDFVSDFVVCNVQPGLTNEHRELAMIKLVAELDKFSAPVLSMGDYNQFDSSKNENKVYEKQRQILENAGYQSVTKHLENQGIQATFIGHPFDILRFLTAEEKSELDKINWKENSLQLREFLLNKIKEKNIDLVSTKLDDCYAKNVELDQLNVTSSTILDGEEIHPAQMERFNIQEKVLSLYYKNNGFFSSAGKEKLKPVIASDHIGLEIEYKPGMKK